MILQQVASFSCFLHPHFNSSAWQSSIIFDIFKAIRIRIRINNQSMKIQSTCCFQVMNSSMEPSINRESHQPPRLEVFDESDVGRRPALRRPVVVKLVGYHHMVWVTLPETKRSHLKMDGWDMLGYYFPFGKAYFQGQTVRFREGKRLTHFRKLEVGEI